MSRPFSFIVGIGLIRYDVNMSGDTKGFKIFLLAIILGAFILVAAHQHRYDYFNSGHGGFFGKSLSLKEFFVDKASRKQTDQLEHMGQASEKHNSPPAAEEKPEGKSPSKEKAAKQEVATSAKSEGTGQIERSDRKELSNLLENVAP